jgi:endoglucanase
VTRLNVALSAALSAAAVLISGCGHQPDTSLHPDPPRVSYAPLRHPFEGAELYVDTGTAAARWQAAHDATWLDPITQQPQARWINGPPDLTAARTVADKAGARDELPVFVAYYIPNRGCSGFKQGAPNSAAYQSYLSDLVDALGSTRSVVVLEPDAAAADCFNAERARLLTAAVRRLSNAGHAVYLDAGHARWRSTGEMASRLLRSGIADAEGFAVNVASRQTTIESYRWGLELSDLVGGRDFVIDTSRNGLGPPRGNHWCNPRRQALGPAPQTTRRAHLAALLWIKAPGESDGKCGGENTFLFSPRQASNLIAQSPRLPAPARQAAQTNQPN